MHGATIKIGKLLSGKEYYPEILHIIQRYSTSRASIN
jgi:hypothetical protein